ncbi:hypothetical protein ACQJBY_004220 [Aegilops geniculata]
MDSAALSRTCAGLGAPEEDDDDGGAVGYVKGERCLEAAAAGGLPAGLRVEERVHGSGAHHRKPPVRPQPRRHGRRRRKRLNLNSKYGTNDNHPTSSDELTLQARKRRTKTKELPPVNLSQSISQHQETSQGTDSDDDTVGCMLRRIRKRLDGVSRKYDNNDNHPISSDEETLQARKRRTKTKELSLENLSPIISQHQETSQGTGSDDETIGHVLRRIRKRLPLLSNKNDNGDNQQISSDEETLQLPKRRTETKELPLTDLSPSISQHQETSQGTDSDGETIGSVLRRIRKRLDGVSRKYDNNDNHPVSSDEETLQACKRRTKTKELSLENLSPIISQHQETSQGTDSDDETIGHVLRTETKELPLTDLSPSISQHQETSQGTDSEGETIGSMLRRIRKKLDGVSRKYDNNDNHPVSSDEETLQARKCRTKTKELPSVDLSCSISQHQETSQGTDSDGETIGSVLGRGKKKRLLTSDVIWGIDRSTKII